MKPLSVVLTLASSAAVVWACDTITLGPETLAPINQCGDLGGCLAVFPDASVAPTCTNKTCVATIAFRPILVVATPGNAPVAPGITFAVPTDEKIPKGVGPACASVGTGCTFMPSLVATTAETIDVGSLQSLATALQVSLRPNNPTGPGTPVATSLPIVATFHMEWTDPTTKTPRLAQTLGLPIPPIEAVSTPSEALISTAPGPTNGPDLVAGQVLAAFIPGGFSSTDVPGHYRVELVPSEPYSMVPPRVVSIHAGTPVTTFLALPGNGTPVQASTYTIQNAAGAPNLAGWTAYVVDSHGFRLTGKVNLAGVANETFTLYDATGTGDQTGQRLLVMPPNGVPLPSYVTKALAQVLSRQVSYPGLPSQVSVSGTVVLDSAPSRFIGARIVFLADGSTGGSAVTTTDINNPDSQQLYYRAETMTNSLGQYQITLPPGKYQTYVIPSDADLALTTSLQVIAAGQPIQNGKGLQVQSRFHLRGQVMLGDGTAVPSAQVVVDPSADAPLDPNTFDPLALPRESFGLTDAKGQFDVLVDPGTVDISVRPQDGTRYPWAVTTNWKVLTDTTLPKTIVIPPPGDPATTRSGGQLTDSAGNPLTRTVVRAYGFPPAGPPLTDGGAQSSRGARLLGITTSDDTGQFELYLAPPDP